MPQQGIMSKAAEVAFRQEQRPIMNVAHVVTVE